MAARLTVADIADVRAYENEREEFRRRIIELKERRRVEIGPILALTFENRDTIRFQVQEMARVERLVSDAQIQGELDVYNPLIPDRGSLSATLFLEMQTEEQMWEWLPKLVGIERSIELRIGDGGDAERVLCTPDERHAGALTRAEVTASVHYVRFMLTEAQVARFQAERVAFASIHPAYQHESERRSETKQSLLRDLTGGD